MSVPREKNTFHAQRRGLASLTAAVILSAVVFPHAMGQLQGPIPYVTMVFNGTRVGVFAAAAACPNLWLATPSSAGVTQAMADGLNEPIALGALSQQGRWIWISGVLSLRAFFGPGVISTYSNWLPGEPSDAGICVKHTHAVVGGVTTWGWAAMDCAESLASVCMVPRQTYLTTVRPTPSALDPLALEAQCEIVGGWLPSFLTVGHHAALRRAAQELTGLALLGGDNALNASEMRWTTGPLGSEARGRGRLFWSARNGWAGTQEYRQLEENGYTPTSGTCVFLRFPSLKLVFAPCTTQATLIVCEAHLAVGTATQPSLQWFSGSSQDRNYNDAVQDCNSVLGTLPVSTLDLTYQDIREHGVNTWMSARRQEGTELWNWVFPSAIPVPFWNAGTCVGNNICHVDDNVTMVLPENKCMLQKDTIWEGTPCSTTSHYICDVQASTTMTLRISTSLRNFTSATELCGPNAWPATISTFKHMQRLRELPTSPFVLYFVGALGNRQQEWVRGPLSILTGQTPFFGSPLGVPQCLGRQEPCSFETEYDTGSCVAVQSTSWRFVKIDCEDALIRGVVCETFGDIPPPPPPTTQPNPSPTSEGRASSVNSVGVIAGAAIGALVGLLLLALLVVVLIRRRGGVVGIGGKGGEDEEEDDVANYIYEPLPSTPYATLVRNAPSAPAALRRGREEKTTAAASPLSARKSFTGAGVKNAGARAAGEQLRFSIPADCVPTDFKKPLTRKDGRKYKSAYVSPPARLGDDVLARWGLPPLPPEDEAEKRAREEQHKKALERRVKKLQEKREAMERAAKRRQEEEEEFDEEDEEEEEGNSPPTQGQQTPSQPSQPPFRPSGAAPASSGGRKSNAAPPPPSTGAMDDEELGDLLAQSFPGLAAVDEGEQMDD